MNKYYYFILIFVFITVSIIYSCRPNFKYQYSIQIKNIDAKLSIYKNSYGGATGGTDTKIFLNKGLIREEIINGTSLRKLFVEYDEKSKTIIIYYCGGSIFDSVSLFHYGTEEEVKAEKNRIKIQYITDDFLSLSSQSNRCSGFGF